MGNLHITLCEKLSIRKSKTKSIDNSIKRLYEYTKKNDILLIPLVKEYNLDNLYPIGDEVEKWSTFVVGNDKTYILVKTNHFLNEINENILNKKFYQNIDKKMFDFLDKIWTETLNNNNIQIFVYTKGKLFLLNSYAFKNNKNEIIGAICFIREKPGLIDEDIFHLENNNKNKNNNNNNNNNNNQHHNKLIQENKRLIQENKRLNNNIEIKNKDIETLRKKDIKILVENEKEKKEINNKILNENIKIIVKEEK